MTPRCNVAGIDPAIPFHVNWDAVHHQGRKAGAELSARGGRGQAAAGRLGFSLLELMIVLSILSVITVMAWPRITGRLQQIAAREAAMQLRSDLAEAREAAIRSGEPWALRARLGGGAYEIGPALAFRAHDGTTSADSASMLSGADTLQALRGATNKLPTEPLQPTIENASTPLEPAGATSPLDEQAIRAKELPPDIVFEPNHAHQHERTELTPFPGQQPPSTATPAATLFAEQIATERAPPSGTPLVMNESQPTGLDRAVANWSYLVVFQPDGRGSDAELRLRDTATQHQIRLTVRRLTGAVKISDVERPLPLPPDQQEMNRETLLPPELVQPSRGRMETKSISPTPPPAHRGTPNTEIRR